MPTLPGFLWQAAGPERGGGSKLNEWSSPTEPSRNLAETGTPVFAKLVVSNPIPSRSDQPTCCRTRSKCRGARHDHGRAQPRHALTPQINWPKPTSRLSHPTQLRLKPANLSPNSVRVLVAPNPNLVETAATSSVKPNQTLVETSPKLAEHSPIAGIAASKLVESNPGRSLAKCGRILPTQDGPKPKYASRRPQNVPPCAPLSLRENHCTA